MGCARGLCAAQKVFIFINIAFAMYSGALLATAARLAWDPSTYTWFRFLCAAQYRVSAAYVLAAGLWLAALVYLAAASAPATSRRHARPLHVYSVGVVCLAASEVGYGAWMVASLERWWRTAPQAELARKGIDLIHDLKPVLLSFDRYHDVAMPVYEMIEEVERAAPNNAFVIIVFGVIGIILQIAAFIMARRLARGATATSGGSAGGSAARELTPSDKERAVGGVGVGGECGTPGDDSDSGDTAHEQHDHSHPPGWRKKANLRMYTILDKIF